MSAFSGISTALTGLHAQRRGLEVTGQNIANANTAGYSRQRVEMRAVSGPPVPAVHSVWDGPGAGVEVSDIRRIRDAFLENRGRVEHGQQSYLTGQQQVQTRVEQIFAEPSDTGLGAQLSEFWSGWYDVSINPGDLAARAQLIQRGGIVADGLRSAHASLGSQWGSIREQVDAVTREVNTAADAVAQLNETIGRAHAAGMPVSELTDQRDLHVMRLAELVGATAVNRDDGTMVVHISGSALVNGVSARHLTSVGERRMEDLTDPDAVPVGLRWVDTGDPAVVMSGELASSLEGLGTTLPGYAAQLDDLAETLAEQVNTQHRLGFGLDEVDDRPFFTGTTATSIAVALTDPRQVAAAETAGTLDSRNAQKLGAIGRAADGPDAAYQQFVVGLGVSVQVAERRAEIQSRITTELDATRSAESGVNLDEEMTNMLAFQRAYEAASRVLTTVDGMLDTLINRTGLVGR